MDGELEQRPFNPALPQWCNTSRWKELVNWKGPQRISLDISVSTCEQDKWHRLCKLLPATSYSTYSWYRTRMQAHNNCTGLQQRKGGTRIGLHASWNITIKNACVEPCLTWQAVPYHWFTMNKRILSPWWIKTANTEVHSFWNQRV